MITSKETAAIFKSGSVFAFFMGAVTEPFDRIYMYDICLLLSEQLIQVGQVKLGLPYPKPSMIFFYFEDIRDELH